MSSVKSVQTVKEVLHTNIRDSIMAKQALMNDDAVADCFQNAVQAIVARYRQGGRLYVAGNGGSAADAQHIVAEFVSKLARDRRPLPAEALTVDTSIITAIGNDYGYDQLFARQLRGKATQKDVFLGITTSGQSPNILLALDECKALNIPSIVFAGRDGGPCADKADYCVIAPGHRTSTIQELHIILGHTLCEVVEHELCFKEAMQQELADA